MVSFESNRLPWISLWLVIGSKLTITGHSIENQWWQDYVQVQTFCHCLEYTEVACNHLYHTMFLGKWFMEVMTFRYWREVPIAYKRAGHAQITKGKVEFMTIKSECMFTSIHAQRRASFIAAVQGCIPNWLRFQQFYCCACLPLRLLIGSLI